MPVAENVTNIRCEVCNHPQTEIVETETIPAQGSKPARVRFTMHCLDPKCGASFTSLTADTEIIFYPQEPHWSWERESILFKAEVNGSRQVVCVLPYEVAMDGRLDGHDREENTRAYFLEHRTRIERVASRLIEEAPDDAEMVIIRSLVIS